jgi:hypothetical protein
LWTITQELKWAYCHFILKAKYIFLFFSLSIM